MKNSLFKNFFISLYEVLIEKTRLLFFQNKDDLSFFIKNNILSDNAVTQVVNGSGINLNRFKKTKLPENISFLMLSRIMLDKGVDLYLDAAKQIKSENGKISFIWQDQMKLILIQYCQKNLQNITSKIM